MLPDGRRFWGAFGAAGLLLHAPDAGVLLQHRAGFSHFGGTWGLPGGARHHDETAVQGAIRESAEEAGVPVDGVRVRFTSVLDLDVWSYTTVVASVDARFEPVIGDAESIALAWVPVDEVTELSLHPGFAASWSELRAHLHTTPVLIVDGANVVGSRPDGWWKDRAAAAERLAASLERVGSSGLPAHLLGLSGDRWWPRISLVLEGQGRDAKAQGMHVQLDHAPSDGDSRIVELVADVPDASRAATTVVTADRELGSRVAALGARVVGPRVLLDLLEA